MKRSIDTSIWGDPWFTDLSANGKLVFLYLLTNERSTAAGIFDLSPRRMAFDIGIDQSTAASALEECSGRVRWWPEHSTVWVVNFFRYQAVNDNFLKSAQRTFADLPEAIRQEVVATYPEFDTDPTRTLTRSDYASTEPEPVGNPSTTRTEPVSTGPQTPTHIAKSKELRAMSDEETDGEGARVNAHGADAPPPPGDSSVQDHSPKEPPKCKQRLPGDFVPSAALTDWATNELKLESKTITYETEKFCDHFRGNGDTKLDWPLAWKNWMRRASEGTFSRGRASPGPPRASPAVEPPRIPKATTKAEMDALNAAFMAGGKGNTR